ncbi:MAG TPA: response regulator [Planctomycetota bacterium]|nr:response regulator [Planctomycetota bacterium]HRR82233.1 response regulator [Planctomycetota bacterium]HRT95674.1 response regulator [Planctomycetota bacterium]
MRTVLVVDDEPCVRQLYRDAFEEEGYRVLEAADGQSALDLLAAHGADVAVLDIQMPHVHGIEMVARLHSLRPHLPVIVCSALPKLFNEYAFWNARDQVAALLAKPVEVRALLECAERALRAKAPGPAPAALPEGMEACQHPTPPPGQAIASPRPRH